jgi:hypothetical protein
MARPSRIAQTIVVALAAAAIVLPRPAALVERLYGQGVYPAIQTVLTSASNALPVAVFDVAIVGVGVLVLWWLRAAWRDRRGSGWLRAIWTLTCRLVTLAAAAYLWFLAAWGLNYARPPIEQRLGLAVGAATTIEVRELLDTAIAKANALYLPSRAAGFVPYRAEEDVARALHLVEASHGRPSPTTPATPKPTLLAPYFRMAGVDGLTAPAALETLLNPDLTARERPFTLAHEWAHLSGAAPEADANFVAWLVTQAPGTWAHTQYSGWLFLLSETAAQMPAEARRTALAALADGPRRDLADIARRQQSRVDLVERVGWRVYDSYLKSQGVGEGVRSYSRVVELIVRSRRTVAPGTVPQ